MVNFLLLWEGMRFGKDKWFAKIALHQKWLFLQIILRSTDSMHLTLNPPLDESGLLST
jgi:hypothetical protein